MRIAKIIEGGYEIQEVEFGVVYRWYPERIFVECDCGHKPILNNSCTACGGCGADHASVIRRELSARQQEDEKLHPWRYRHFSDDTGIPA